jgi:hypothetical protein
LRDRREIQLFGLRGQVLEGQGVGKLNEELVSVGKDSRSLWDQTAQGGWVDGLAIRTAAYPVEVDGVVVEC